jgi:peptidoglycan/LPS O-acetylase OafA/YrhL
MKENIIKETKQKIFFPNLDGLRFICFLLVYLYHWNLNCALAIENTSVRNSFNFLFGNGNIGVNIFFVLSGFLITFLLIKEKEFSGGVHLKHFYVRRILRIWPLYFLIVVKSYYLYYFVLY